VGVSRIPGHQIGPEGISQMREPQAWEALGRVALGECEKLEGASGVRSWKACGSGGGVRS
jgi:hypothetical protein